MDMQYERKRISASVVWEILTIHLIPIVLAAILSAGALFVYARFILKPQYTSTATLYILRQENESNYVYTSADFSLALNIVNDCTYMLKSHAVLDEVIGELQLPMSYDSLSRSISTRNPDNSRILEVMVRSVSGAEAKRIVDAVCRIGAEKISEAMGMNQVNVYELGTVETRPSNSVNSLYFYVVGLLAALAVYAAYLIAFVLDDRVRTEEDVQKYLNLSVLGDIPNADKSSRGGRYYRYGSRYGKNKYYAYSAKPSKEPKENSAAHVKGGRKDE